MRTWDDVWEGLKNFFLQFADNYVEYILQFILLSLLFYSVFKILKTNKGGKYFSYCSAALFSRCRPNLRPICCS